jgi:cytochrome b pre-mRNA-processing protein 3
LSGIQWFKPPVATLAGQTLFEEAVKQARSPEFYRDLGVADTVLGRFELYTLHVVLLAERLRGRGPAAQEACQAMFDAYLLNLDIALREMGVGDLSMGKKMKKLGRAFYGRMKSWQEAQGDEGAQAALISRTVYEGQDEADIEPLARYLRSAREALAAQDESSLLEGRVAWRQVAS